MVVSSNGSSSESYFTFSPSPQTDSLWKSIQIHSNSLCLGFLLSCGLSHISHEIFSESPSSKLVESRYWEVFRNKRNTFIYKSIKWFCLIHNLWTIRSHSLWRKRVLIENLCSRNILAWITISHQYPCEWLIFD